MKKNNKVLLAWIQAFRVPYLITQIIPVLLALAFVARLGEAIHWDRFVLVLVCCFLGLTLANFANDLFDYLLGADDDNLGGSGGIQSGLIKPWQIAVALVVLVIAILLLGAWLINISGQHWLWGAVAFGLFSAIFYVAPPIKYGYRGLAEFFVGINMGFLMVAGTVTVLCGRFIPASLALALPLALMVAGILYYQNIPQIETDPRAGKHTLASKLGKEGAALIYRLWWPTVWILMLNLWVCGLADWPVVLGLLSLPFYCIADYRIQTILLKDAFWFTLDRYGWLVRMLYLVNGVALILGVAYPAYRPLLKGYLGL